MFKHPKCLLLMLLFLLLFTAVKADIRIYGLEDFQLGRWVLGAGSLRANANLCVSIRPRGPYQITAYGQGTTNAFILSDAGEELPFRIFFNDRPRPNGAVELAPGQASGGFRGRRRGINRQQCNRPTANISIFISDSDLASISAGRYSGTITIIAGPE